MSVSNKPIVEINSEYTEKIWGKSNGEDFTTDGYAFRGKKKTFRKALVGLKKLMKKGVENEIGNIKFKALDVKEKGAGLEIDVEIGENKNRGISILKLYGPNDKKANSVTVTKCKESEAKYIILLAEKVIKPLMMKFLSEETKDEKTVSDEKTDPDEKVVSAEKKASLFKCHLCEKTCASSGGLKGHMTKMHALQNKKRKSLNEVHEVVETLLKEVIEISDEQCKEEITLDESVLELNKKGEKKYEEKCEGCGFEVEAKRKYTAFQLMIKHKEICVNKKCTECDFTGKDRFQLKRHKRDAHGINSSSTSPPMKKKRQQNQVGKGEPMEVEKLSDDEDEKVEDLSLKLEDMEIDETVVEPLDVNIIPNMSDLMDEKIKEKEKRTFQREMKIQNDRKQTELKKKKDKEEELQKMKMLTKQRKQKLKDSKRKLKKKSNIKRTFSENKKMFKIPNIEAVPENCRHLVNEGDVVYVVPGDGCCGPNCGAAFLFKDEVFGPKLRSGMNLFFANHWYDRYQYLTQCSSGHPFVRMVKGKEESFTDPEELIKYLKTSKDAQYMWSDSEDLAVLADMYQVTIKVITTKGIMDDKPTVNFVYPEAKMAEYAELRNVDLGEMVLLHDNDSHFNLIVSRDSDLATLGSLSYRFNIGPIVKIPNIDGVSQ